MAGLTIHSSTQSGRIFQTENVPEHLNNLPERVRDVFRQKIGELRNARGEFMLGEKTETEYFHAEGRKQIKTTHFMSRPDANGLGPDRNSPLFTEVELDPVNEAIPRVAPEVEEIPENGKPFCSKIFDLIGKICDWFRNFFARFFR